MKKYHIQAKQHWEPFQFEGKEYPLDHLNSHEVIFQGNKDTYKFVVTYGLHCFTKDDKPNSINFCYSDSYESRQVDLERYQASKKLRNAIESLDNKKLIYETTQVKYFTIEMINNIQDVQQEYKVCLCIFKENRLLRIHVTTAFFLEEEIELTQKSYSIFKLGLDAKRKPRNMDIPKEANR